MKEVRSYKIIPFLALSRSSKENTQYKLYNRSLLTTQVSSKHSEQANAPPWVRVGDRLQLEGMEEEISNQRGIFRHSWIALVLKSSRQCSSGNASVSFAICLCYAGPIWSLFFPGSSIIIIISEYKLASLIMRAVERIVLNQFVYFSQFETYIILFISVQ